MCWLFLLALAVLVARVYVVWLALRATSPRERPAILRAMPSVLRCIMFTRGK
jgi:hypothetical protein